MKEDEKRNRWVLEQNQANNDLYFKYCRDRMGHIIRTLDDVYWDCGYQPYRYMESRYDWIEDSERFLPDGTRERYRVPRPEFHFRAAGIFAHMAILKSYGASEGDILFSLLMGDLDWDDYGSADYDNIPDKEDKDFYLRALGNRLRYFTKEVKEIKLSELAERTGMYQPFISDIFNGKREMSVYTFYQIAEGLHLRDEEVLSALLGYQLY